MIWGGEPQTLLILRTAVLELFPGSVGEEGGEEVPRSAWIRFRDRPCCGRARIFRPGTRFKSYTVLTGAAGAEGGLHR